MRYIVDVEPVGSWIHGEAVWSAIDWYRRYDRLQGAVNYGDGPIVKVGHIHPIGVRVDGDTERPTPDVNGADDSVVRARNYEQPAASNRPGRAASGQVYRVGNGVDGDSLDV